MGLVSNGTLATPPLSGLEKIPVGGAAGAVTNPNQIRTSFVSTKTDSYQLVLADAFGTILMNKATATNLTIPPEGTEAWVDNTTIYFMRIGAGQMTFVAGSGVTLTSSAGALTDAGQNVLMAATKIGTNTWYIQNGISIDAVPTTRTINDQALSANLSLPMMRGQSRIPGFWYAVNDLNVSTYLATANPNNLLRAFPFFIERDWEMSQLKSEVTTASGSTLYRIGLYTDNGSGYPDTLVTNSDTGEFDSSTTGVKTGSFAANITLTPGGSPRGLYWIVLGANSAGASLRQLGNINAVNILGHPPTMGNVSGYAGYSVAYTFAALPATFPGSGSLLANGSYYPLVLFDVI